MNRKRFIIVASILAVLFISYVLFFHKEKAIKQSDNETTLTYQEGLPSIVEAKRQAIYNAAISRDYEKLAKETGPNFDYSFGGEYESGFVGYLKLAEKYDNKSAFDIIPVLLKLPYTKYENIYGWPSFLSKSSDKWTKEDIAQMKALLTDEEIESYRMFGGYAYYRIGITDEGNWTYYLAGD